MALYLKAVKDTRHFAECRITMRTPVGISSEDGIMEIMPSKVQLPIGRKKSIIWHGEPV